jgi:hypothetical protein
MVKSYIRIYGPPISEALKELEKIAEKMPDITYQSRTFGIPVEREIDPISKTGTILGESDFYFEWNIKPDEKMVDDLIKRIDEALAPLGCKYTITTK